VLQLGIFNADPHPGNVLILADGLRCDTKRESTRSYYFLYRTEPKLY